MAFVSNDSVFNFIELPKPSFQEAAATPAGSMVSRAVKWFKAEGEPENVQLWRRVAAIALAAILVISLIGIPFLIEGIHLWNLAVPVSSKQTPVLDQITLGGTKFSEIQIPLGTFGKAEWEKTFPVTIKEIPPLPKNIHAILEQEDPCEPGKKLKETCQLFLRPNKVTLHEKSGDKEIALGFDGVEELAMKATNEKLRTQYDTIYRDQMNQIPVAESGWVLMRKEVIPNSRKKNFSDQQTLLKGGFEVPKLMDAILLNILTYASSGKRLYGVSPWTYTRCQEKLGDNQAIVGGIRTLGGLHVYARSSALELDGLSGSWKF